MKETNQALLIIDVQIGSFLEKKPLYKENELLKNIQLLISKARLAKVPIFYTKHDGKRGTLLQKGTLGWEIHPSIFPSKNDIIIEKHHPDSFQQTNFHKQLKIKNIKQIVITGIQSEICVDATCRRAYSEGYNVTLVKDGHSTYHSNSLNASQIIDHHNEIIGQWFANVKKTKEVIFEPSQPNNSLSLK